MIFKKLHINKFFSNTVAPVILTLIIYTAITGVFIANLDRLVTVRTRSSDDRLIEALLYPKGVPNVTDSFNVDPLVTSTDNDTVLDVRRSIAFLIYSSLVKERPDGSLAYDLVEKLEFKNANHLEIKLREDVYWHDGEKLTAEDVIFTLNLIRSVGDNSIYYGAVNGGDITYRTNGDYGVVIDLLNKDIPINNAAYLYELKFPILPKHILQNFSQNQIRNFSNSNNEYLKNPIGSGVMIFNNLRGTELELVSNPYYYGNKTKFDRYVLRFYQEESAIAKDFQLKNIDIYSARNSVNNDSFNTLGSSTRQFNTVLKNINHVLYFNLSENKQDRSHLVKSISLRNGIMKVINKDKLVQRTGGKTKVAYGPIDKSSWAFSPEVELEQKTNIEEFKKRAEALGYKKDGEYFKRGEDILGFKLTFLNGDFRDAIADQIRSDLKEAGVLVSYDVIDTDSLKNGETSGRSLTPGQRFHEVVNNRDFEVLLSSVNQNQDPDRFSQWHSDRIDPPGLNISGFDTAVGDLMLSQGRLESDQEKRKERYVRFQRAFVQDVPAIYLLYAYSTTYYSIRLKNIEQAEINDNEHKYQNIHEWEIL